MGYIKKEREGEFDFDKLPEGIYFFSGQEGFVKIEVNKDGHQSWDLQNWFASLDPDKDEAQHQKTIEDIKKRLNADTGIINPSKKQEKKCEYEKLNEYYKDGELIFDISKQPLIADFSVRIGEEPSLVAQCKLNTPENFPYKTNKDGTPKKPREYYSDDPNYTGKKVDYVAEDEGKWNDSTNEWLYLLVYNKRIVKIGMTITCLLYTSPSPRDKRQYRMPSSS